MQAPDLAWPARRHWLVGAGLGMMLGVLFLWHQLPTATEPEIRLAATNQAVSAQLVDDDTRILILNARGPQDGRSVLGQLNRPWEDRPATIIVGADRNNVVEALWEVVQRLDARQIIVAGAPGNDAEWSELERYCRDHGIDVKYLNAMTLIDAPSIELRIVPPTGGASSSTGSYVEVIRGGTRIGFKLGGDPLGERYHVVVSGDSGAGPGWADIYVAAAGFDSSDSLDAIVLEPGDRIDIRFAEGRLGIHGKPAEAFAPN